jgi:hypothetical protein
MAPIRRIIRVLALAALLTPAASRAQQPAMPEPHRKAVTSGTAWLLARQNENGSVGGPRGRTAVTALAGLALIASGSTPDDGAHRQPILKAADYILSKATADGLLSDEPASPMYNHGFALLFLCEVYSSTSDQPLKDKLKPVIDRALAVTARSQNQEGGWRYQPRPLDADVSVTAAQVNALNAAQRAGFDLDRQVLARAIKYVEDCRNDDGGYRYMSGRAGAAASGAPRSAAALAVLLHTGLKPDADDAKATQEYLAKAANADRLGHYFYLHYYRSQAALHADADKQYHKAIADELVKSQQKDGRWRGDVSDEYGTAMALFVLQLPHHPPAVFKPRPR